MGDIKYSLSSHQNKRVEMNFKEIQDLIKLIGKTNLSEFKLKDGEFELTIRTDEYHKTKAGSSTQQVIPLPATTP